MYGLNRQASKFRTRRRAAVTCVAALLLTAACLGSGTASAQRQATLEVGRALTCCDVGGEIQYAAATRYDGTVVSVRWAGVGSKLVIRGLRPGETTMTVSGSARSTPYGPFNPADRPFSHTFRVRVVPPRASGGPPAPQPGRESRPEPEAFGAIAYSESTGRFGSAWRARTQEEADERAVAACRTVTVRSGTRRGDDCEVVVSFRNACGALARARNGGVAWHEGRTLYEARLLTSNRCTGEWGGCKLICSVCSNGDEP